MPFSDDLRLIEHAALGISGASLAGDVAYAQLRRAELGAAAERLRPLGLDVPTLLTKADRLLRACGQRDHLAAQRLTLDIHRQLNLLPCA